MGLCVSLETEDGKSLDMVADDKNILHRLLPKPGSSNELLSAIDWYGDTTFNNLQIRQFLSEWDTVMRKAASSEEQTLISDIKKLALRCQEESHLYLKFIGD